MLHPGPFGQATPVVPSLPGWSGRPFIVTTFRNPSAYSPLSVGVVLATLKLRSAFDRDLVWVVYCLKYSDSERGTGTSLRQLVAAYKAATGATTSKDRVRESLSRLSRVGIIRCQKVGKGLSVCLPVTTSDHTRTLLAPVTPSDRTRTLSRGSRESNWPDRSLPVTTTGHSQCPEAVTPSDHTRDTETLEGCTDRYMPSRGVREETAATAPPRLGREGPAALDEDENTKPEPLPMTAALKALSPFARYDDTLDRPGGEVERRDQLKAQVAAILAAEQGDEGVER